MAVIQAALYAPDGSHVQDLPRLADWKWTHVHNEPGTGEVSLRADDQAIEAQAWMVDGEPVMVDVTPVLIGHDFATRHYMVKLQTETGEVFAFRVDPPTSTDVVAAKQTKTLHLAGRGVGALLDQVPILPEGGMGWAPPSRPCSWISRHFEPWADVVWTVPNTHGTAAAPENEEWEQLEDWVEIANAAEWMYLGTKSAASGASNYHYIPQYAYFRATLTLTEGMDVGYFFTADDEGDFWRNGEHLISTQGTGQWRKTHTPEINRYHEPGDHHIRIRARNLERPESEIAPDSAAGVLFAACRLNTLGEPVEVLMVSGSTGWLALGDPDHPPGMTPGLKFGLFVGEAKDRGEIPAVTVDTFDAEFATPRPDAGIGEEWLDNTATSVAHGTSVLSALMADAESVVDWEMTPDLELHLWGHDRRARDLTGGDAPVRPSVEKMTVGPPRRMVNALMVETGEGFYFEVTDEDSISLHGRFADFVKLGEHDTPESARPVAEQMLADRASAEQSCDVTLAPNSRFLPYEDFTFDVIELPARAGSSFERWRVQVISCSRGKGDKPLWQLQCVLEDA